MNLYKLLHSTIIMEEDANLGLIAGCRTAEWDSLDEKGINEWFEEHRKLTFKNGAVFENSA